MVSSVGRDGRGVRRLAEGLGRSGWEEWLGGVVGGEGMGESRGARQGEQGMRGLVLRLKTRESSHKAAPSRHSAAAWLLCAMRCAPRDTRPCPALPCPANFNPSQSKARQRNATQSNAGRGPAMHRNTPQSSPTAAGPDLALKTPSPPHRPSTHPPAAVAPTPNPAPLCSALLCSALLCSTRPGSARLCITHH